MARTVYFHVGAPKTGTTFLQGVLLRNQEALKQHEILYASGTYPPDRVWAQEELRGIDHRKHPNPNAPGAWERVSAQIRDWPGTAVFSHEFLGLCTVEQVRRALADVGPADIHVVFTARDYVRQFSAVWQERLKYGEAVPFEDFDLNEGPPVWTWQAQDAPAILRRWGADLDPSAIHVITVPPPGSGGDVLWRRFASVIGVDPEVCVLDSSRNNSSLGVVEAELVRRVCERLPDELRSPRTAALNVRDVLADRVLAARKGKRLTVDPGRGADLVEKSRQMSEELSRSGYQIVGDLAELVPANPDAQLQPAHVGETELFDASLDALVGLLSELEKGRLARERLRRRNVQRFDGARDVAPGGEFADDNGLTLSTPTEAVLDVYFDGRRIWSVTPKRDRRGRPLAFIAWPPKMRKRLDGRSFVEVRRHSDDTVLESGSISFGSGKGRLDFTDSHGRLLTLNKWGTFTRTFETTPREVVEGYLDDVEAVLQALQDECGVPAFISYGTLLGAVRERKLVGHDVDVDLGYLSKYTHPVDVVRESLHIERVVRSHGWRVVRQNGGFLAAFMPQRDGSTRNLDIFTAFFVGDRLYQVHDIGTEARVADVLPLQRIPLEGRELPAPANPELFLEAAYGPGWRVPDPGFSFATPRENARRIHGWLGWLRRERDWWAERYTGLRDRGPSEFARWVAEQQPAGRLIDVGCGRGDDTTYYLGQGLDVVGVDFVSGAVKAARNRAAGYGDRAQFAVCNLYSASEPVLLGAKLARGSGPTTVTARMLFEDLRADGRDAFWRLCRTVLRGGGRAFIETSNEPSKGNSAAGSRFIPVKPEELIEEARERGGRLLAREEHPVAEEGQPARHMTRIVLEW